METSNVHTPSQERDRPRGSWSGYGCALFIVAFVLALIVIALL